MEVLTKIDKLNRLFSWKLSNKHRFLVVICIKTKLKPQTKWESVVYANVIVKLYLKVIGQQINSTDWGQTYANVMFHSRVS